MTLNSEIIEALKNLWKSPEYLAKIKKPPRTPEFRAKNSKRMTDRWADPEYRAKMSETTRKRWIDSEYRVKMTKMLRERAKDKEWTDKMSKARKKRWKNPEERKKQSKLAKDNWNEDKLRERMSKGIKETWAKQEVRDKVSGENHYNWKGGISKHPYPFEFNEVLKTKIRERDGYKCALCGVPDSLDVHHINYVKWDVRPENLITLCKSCHVKTNYNREAWIEYFTLKPKYILDHGVRFKIHPKKLEDKSIDEIARDLGWQNKSMDEIIKGLDLLSDKGK